MHLWHRLKQLSNISAMQCIVSGGRDHEAIREKERKSFILFHVTYIASCWYWNWDPSIDCPAHYHWGNCTLSLTSFSGQTSKSHETWIHPIGCIKQSWVWFPWSVFARDSTTYLHMLQCNWYCLLLAISPSGGASECRLSENQAQCFMGSSCKLQQMRCFVATYIVVVD